MTETEGRTRPKYLKLGEGSGANEGASALDAPSVTLTRGELGALVEAAVERVVTARAAERPLLLDREGLASALGCSSSHIDKLRRQGLPTLKFGESPRFEVDRCLEWIRKQGAA
jgi:hypothetical protein